MLFLFLKEDMYSKIVYGFIWILFYWFIILKYKFDFI